ncbi:hypothetical protein TNCV_2674791 [Trichonephila clavipes]|nr:hypothetical protein TNCV_2674791 [Trichonephila clavipes]
MSLRRKRATFQQLSELERGRLIDLREGGLSYRAIASHMQRNSSAVISIWTQCIDDSQTARKSGNDTDKRRQRAMTDIWFYGLRVRTPLNRTPSRKIIGAYAYNRHMDTGTGFLIGSKCFSVTNPTFICSSMVVAFVLDAMSVNAILSGASSATLD